MRRLGLASERSPGGPHWPRANGSPPRPFIGFGSEGNRAGGDRRGKAEGRELVQDERISDRDEAEVGNSPDGSRHPVRGRPLWASSEDGIRRGVGDGDLPGGAGGEGDGDGPDVVLGGAVALRA